MAVVLENREQIAADMWWSNRAGRIKMRLFWQHFGDGDHNDATAEQRLFIYERETSTPHEKARNK
ncbi:MAG: hypothetical protein EOO51_12710 [Flavobacterium sp.]|nr:MAG: hypothetical protein EOO51_12710 [Flavobacterium sp.]